MIDYWDVNIEKIFKKHNELQIAYAVLKFLETRIELKILIKKHYIFT